VVAHLRVIEPRNKNRSVPHWPANAELRSSEYLTVKEIDRLGKACRDGRYAHRDATLILIAFRHGLRACEICDLETGRVRPLGVPARQAEITRSAVTKSGRYANYKRRFPHSGCVFATERGRTIHA
jgi:hypothetical protein